MGRKLRFAAVAVLATGVMLVAATSVALAQPSGDGPGNSPNTKECHKGGWEDLERSDGTDFTSEEECVAYAAQGGQVQPQTTPLEVCKQQLADAGLTEPTNANYVLGTAGDDIFSDASNPLDDNRNDVVCGFGGDDVISDDNALLHGDVFLAGDGNDSVVYLVGGTFNGDAGDDSTPAIGNSGWAAGGGTFNGGDGNDYVHEMHHSATFNGGAGNDRVDDFVNAPVSSVFNGGDGNDSLGSIGAGTFNGDAGDDSVTHLAGGTFNGGDGNDSVADLTQTRATFNGGAGNDSVIQHRGGTFNGGAGDDSVTDLDSGRNMYSVATFNGGAGNDSVTDLRDGPYSGATFNGGEGDDSVTNLHSGAFNGDAGDDSVANLHGGTFKGGDGCDSVAHQDGGTFEPDDQSTCA